MIISKALEKLRQVPGTELAAISLLFGDAIDLNFLCALYHSV